MAAPDINNSPYLQPLPRGPNHDILGYSRHYARRATNIGKSTKESWIKKLWSHVFTRKKNGEQARVDARDAQAQEKHKERLAESVGRANTIGQGDVLKPSEGMRKPVLPPIRQYTSKVNQREKEVSFTSISSSRSRENLTGARSRENVSVTSHSTDRSHYRDQVSTDRRENGLSKSAPTRTSREKRLAYDLMNSPYMAPSDRPNYRAVLLDRQKEYLRNKEASKERKEKQDRRPDFQLRTLAKDPNPPARPKPDYVHITGQVDSWRVPKLSRGVSYSDLEGRAKKEAGRAVKASKIFSCEMHFPMDAYIRYSLRKRGWVEKFNPTIQNSSCRGGTSSKLQCDDDEDFETICEQGVPAPWDEEHGVYAIMSRLVRNYPARFIWGSRAVNSMVVRDEVMLNHWPKARYFTSKTSIVESLREAVWYSCDDALGFFPRCYLLSEDEKEDLIDDFRLTACMSVLKWVLKQVEEDRLRAELEALRAIEEEKEEELEEKEEDCDGESEQICANAEIVVYKDEEEDDEKPDDDSDELNPNQNMENTDRDDDMEREEDYEDEDSDSPNVRHSNINQVHNTNEPQSVDSTDRSVASPNADMQDSSTNGDSGDDKMDTDDQDGQTDAAKDSSDAVDPNGNNTDNSDQPVEPAPIVRVLPDISKKEGVGGQVPRKLVDWALLQCEHFARFKTHDDLDIKQQKMGYLQPGQWDTFLKWYYRLAHDGARISGIESKVEECEVMLERMQALWPQLDIDGLRNIWIVKPGAKSKGIGICFCDRLDDILKYIENTTFSGNYVVQKYIERPLLLYNCKFDIRQWFLVTDWNPLTVWFYKDCYLRICSQEYSYDSMHESVHLSNVSIQQYYLNGQRSEKIPDNNFMDSNDFQRYLSEIGAGHAWDEIIYPGMKRSVMCTMLSTLDVAENRKTAFELYGADFMMSDDFVPWLLEINASPGMAPSSKEKAKLCAAVVEDTIKVVLDYKEDKSCDTGRFELVFKDSPIASNFRCVDNKLHLKGSRIRKVVWEKFSEIDRKAAKIEAEKLKKEKLKQEKKRAKEEERRKSEEKERAAQEKELLEQKEEEKDEGGNDDDEEDTEQTDENSNNNNSSSKNNNKDASKSNKQKKHVKFKDDS